MISKNINTFFTVRMCNLHKNSVLVEEACSLDSLKRVIKGVIVDRAD